MRTPTSSGQGLPTNTDICNDISVNYVLKKHQIRIYLVIYLVNNCLTGNEL